MVCHGLLRHQYCATCALGAPGQLLILLRKQLKVWREISVSSEVLEKSEGAAFSNLHLGLRLPVKHLLGFYLRYLLIQTFTFSHTVTSGKWQMIHYILASVLKCAEFSARLKAAIICPLSTENPLSPNSSMFDFQWSIQGLHRGKRSTWGLLNRLLGKLHSRRRPRKVMLEASSYRRNITTSRLMTEYKHWRRIDWNLVVVQCITLYSTVETR